jgi:phasin
MSKVSAKPAPAAGSQDYPSFDASKTVDQFRVLAEKGVEQSREAYAKLKEGAEDAQKTIETTFETAKTAGADLSLKAIAAVRANAEADFSHIEALIGVKSLSELIELQTAYLRKRFELAVQQTKEMQGASSRAAEEIARPVKGAFEKAFKDFKAA